jgi:putative transposase
MNTIYHVVNLGLEKKLIFIDKKDLDRFIQLIDYYRFENPSVRFSFRKRSTSALEENKQPLVTILCYTMMPDHFHLLLEEEREGSVSKFLSLVTNSYTKYFNARYKRSGPLFKGVFKREYIHTSDHLIQVAAYIHTEPVKKGIIENIKKFPFSSYLEYIGVKQGFCSIQPLMEHFATVQEYENSIMQQLSKTVESGHLDS